MDLVIAVITLFAAIIGLAVAVLGVRSAFRKRASDAAAPGAYAVGSTDDGSRELSPTGPLPALSIADLSEAEVSALAHLVHGSAQLLLADHLNGTWGKTIGTYVEATQNRAKFEPHQIRTYLLSGSLTHAYHALNGLRFYHVQTATPFPDEITLKVVRYLSTWRLKVGGFATPVTNFDEAAGMDTETDIVAQERFRRNLPNAIRHTSSGLLAIEALLALSAVSSRMIDRRKRREIANARSILIQYRSDAARFLAAHVETLSLEAGPPGVDPGSVWGQFQYTPAYVVLAVRAALRASNHLDQCTIVGLVKLEAILAKNFIAECVSRGQAFICHDSTPKACHYFTTFVIDAFLQSPAFVQAPGSRETAFRLLEALSDVVEQKGGLGFGDATEAGMEWLEEPDVGVSSRFLLAVGRCSGAFGDLPSSVTHAFARALEFVSASTIDSPAFIPMTHGWEAVLGLVEHLGDDLRLRIMANCQQLTTQGMEDPGTEAVVEEICSGRRARDMQALLLDYMRSDQEYGTFAEELDGMLDDGSAVARYLESRVSAESFRAFLERHKLHSRAGASLSEMVNLTLWQFQVID